MSHARRRGSALMAVFWLMMVLAVIVVTAAKMLNVSQRGMVVRVGQVTATANAWKGVALALHPEMRREESLLRTEEWNVLVESEDVRINPNVVLQRGDDTLLLDLFMSWGVDEDRAQAVVDAMRDWIDGDDLPGLSGAEADAYEALGRVGQPLNRPFADLNEMAAVLGMDAVAAVRPDWRNWFSVYAGAQVNIAEAPAEMIAAVGGFTLKDAATFVSERNGEDGIAGTEDDLQFGTVPAAVATVGSPELPLEMVVRRFSLRGSVLRVTSTGASGNVQRTITVVARQDPGRTTVLAELSD